MFKNHRKFISTFVALLFVSLSFAQTSTKDVPKGWHLKDLSKDGYYGISLDKAYEFVKNKQSKTVIVAVIDSGIDTTHEDLKPVLCKNLRCFKIREPTHILNTSIF